ncbi:putative glycerol-3-phosphate O-acyltransferase/Dihydroxyacetone phosphate acyltransferase [Plasmopara halstedii]
MLKPMGKKHRLDEWRGAPLYLPRGVTLPAHLRPLFMPNNTAWRLQLRYQKYQEKVRSLLKKTDASQQQEHAARASGRVVAISSMALALTVKTKEKSPEPVKTASLYLNTEKWTLNQDWTTLQQDTRQFMSDTKVKSDGQPPREYEFVNIMESTWLLSSIEQRCAARASEQTTSRFQPSLIRQLMDVKLAVVDLLFISRAGTDVNLRGRTPLSANKHYQNLLTRVTTSSTMEIEQVKHIFENLKSDMVLPAVKCLGWLLTKMWRLLFHGLYVDVESLHRVRRVLEGSEGDVSIVFAPTHKSHLDYLIISYLCFAYGIPLPRIAAGNNLNIPLVGKFLRANGSFFIRRSFRDDLLYKEVLENYVHELLYDGNPIEVFLEGGRSRHGRVCKPRLGFMSMFLNYVKQRTPQESGNEDDTLKKTILVVPISLDYEKVYEVDGYANQLLGKPKEKESLVGLLRSMWDLFFVRLGHSYVRFGEPVPLTHTSSLEESANLVAERMQISGTITSTAIVSALLMWKRAYMTTAMLESRTFWLVGELKKRKATVTHVDIDAIAAHALSILNIEVMVNDIVTPHLRCPVRALELGFYRNHLLHIFLPDMAVISALDTVLRRQSFRCDGCNETLRKIDIEAVKLEARKIWQFLRHICRHAMINVDTRVDSFLTEHFTSCVDETSATVVVAMNTWNRMKLVSFVLSLNWSFMDSWWLTIQGLWSLSDCVENTITEREIIRRVQTLAKKLFSRQQLFHAEALCSESIKQTLGFLAECNVVHFEQSQDSTSRSIRLNLKTEALEYLTREVNARRKPQKFLWRQDEQPHNLTREEALTLLKCNAPL